MASPPEPAIPVPSPLSSRLGAAADAAAASSSAPIEHPCFTLQNWWLVRVEGAERKIAVSGFTQRDDAFTSAPIAKRHGPLVLEDEDGVVVRIDGLMNLSRMRRNGFSPQICENFLIGFPSWWESWDSQFASQPISSSNSQEDSSLIYLKFFQLGNVFQKSVASFIKNPLHDAKNFRRCVADAFTQCSRFDEYTFDNDFSTKGKTAASNDASEGPAAIANEVDNMEIDLIVSSTSQERGHVDISCNASAPTENCTSDETYKEAENQNDTMHPDATEHEAGSHTDEDMATFDTATLPIASTPLQSEYEERPVIHKFYTRAHKVNKERPVIYKFYTRRAHKVNEERPVIHKFYTRRAHKVNEERPVIHKFYTRKAHNLNVAHDSPLTRGRAQSLSISTPESLKMKRTKSGRVVVPSLDLGCERILYDNNHLVLGVAPVKLHSPLIKGSKSQRLQRRFDLVPSVPICSVFISNDAHMMGPLTMRQEPDAVPALMHACHTKKKGNNSTKLPENSSTAICFQDANHRSGVWVTRKCGNTLLVTLEFVATSVELATCGSYIYGYG